MAPISCAGYGRWVEHVVRYDAPMAEVERVVGTICRLVPCLVKYFTKHVAPMANGRLRGARGTDSHQEPCECVGA